MSNIMKGIRCCADCANYNMKKHKCPIAKDEGGPTDRFYVDCPLPTVVKESEWINLQTGMPPANDLVIVSINDDRGDNDYRYTDAGWYLTEGKCWIVDNEATINVEAWMPFPKPYKPPKEG